MTAVAAAEEDSVAAAAVVVEDTEVDEETTVVVEADTEETADMKTQVVTVVAAVAVDTTEVEVATQAEVDTKEAAEAVVVDTLVVEVDTLVVVVEAMTVKEVAETQANGAASKVIIEWMGVFFSPASRFVKTRKVCLGFCNERVIVWSTPESCHLRQPVVSFVVSGSSGPWASSCLHGVWGWSSYLCSVTYWLTGFVIQ